MSDKYTAAWWRKEAASFRVNQQASRDAGHRHSDTYGLWPSDMEVLAAREEAHAAEVERLRAALAPLAALADQAKAALAGERP